MSNPGSALACGHDCECLVVCLRRSRQNRPFWLAAVAALCFLVMLVIISCMDVTCQPGDGKLDNEPRQLGSAEKAMGISLR